MYCTDLYYTRLDITGTDRVRLRQATSAYQYASYRTVIEAKVKLMSTWSCIAPCREHTSKALRYGTRSQGISQFYLHTPRSAANDLPFPSQPKLVLIYQPRRDGRLSWPGWLGGLYTIYFHLYAKVRYSLYRT